MTDRKPYEAWRYQPYDNWYVEVRLTDGPGIPEAQFRRWRIKGPGARSCPRDPSERFPARILRQIAIDLLAPELGSVLADALRKAKD